MDRNERYVLVCDLHDYIDIVTLVLLERETDTSAILHFEDDETPRSNERAYEHRIEPSRRATVHEILRKHDPFAQRDERSEPFFKRHDR